MDLATITEDPHVARRKFLEYRDAVRERHDQEDEEIMRAYRAIARGEQLIKLTDALRRGGVEIRTFRSGGRDLTYRLPRLAVARADAEWLYTEGIRKSGALHTALRPDRDMHPNNRRDRLNFPAGTFPRHDKIDREWWREARAMVPKVPPPFRPAHKLSGYHILFEAEWGLSPIPPGDPALLKRISGDLFAVVAVWNLTDVERAVLAGRTVD